MKLCFAWRCIKPFHEGVSFLFGLFTHALIPLFLNASCSHLNIQRRVIAQFVSYGALANLPVDKLINHSGFIMSLSFCVLFFFFFCLSTAMTIVCFLQRTWNCSHRKAAGDSWGITGHSAWRENNPICLLVEHIFHLYRMKKTKTFLVVAAVSVSVLAKQRFVFHLKLTLSTLCCNFSGTWWYICLILLQKKTQNKSYSTFCTTHALLRKSWLNNTQEKSHTAFSFLCERDEALKSWWLIINLDPFKLAAIYAHDLIRQLWFFSFIV